MKNMKYILLTICLFGLLTSFARADAGVNKLHLFEQNGEMVLRVDVSGPFQFSHQIAEDKEGKPFRVLIDVFPAVHSLPQKSFVNLPPSIIQSIRTSQYAVNPEKIVRVVCDLKNESVYRIEKKGSSVYMYIPDKGRTNFPNWTSADIQTKNQVTPPPPVPTEKVVTRPMVKTEVPNTPPPVVSVQPESTYYTPQQSSMMEKEWAATEPVKKTSKPKQEPKKEEKPKTETTKTEPPKTEKPSVTTELAGTDPPAVKTSNKKVPTVPEKTAAIVDKSQKPATKTEEKFDVPSTPMVLIDPKDNAPEKEQTATAKEKKPEPDMSIQTPEVVSKPEKTAEDKSKSTSHFRRQPSLPARLKGTIVAEFPTRMVIKYQPGQSRDPFASLIGEKKNSSGEFGQQKLLDIETARLVGILENAAGQNSALVEDLDGYGYILKKGDRIKKGYVSKIYTDKALFQIFEYGWSRAHALHLDDE